MSDSSSIALPDNCQERFHGRGGSGKSALKLQTELELRSGRLTCVAIEQGKDADVASPRQQVKREAGTLRIADLGYFDISVFNALAVWTAYFLSRIQRTTLLRIDGEVVGNVGTWLSKCKETVVDRWLVIGTQKRMNCRLIAWRVDALISFTRIAKRISAIVDSLAFGLYDVETSQQKLDDILALFRIKTKLSARQDKHRKPGTIELLRNPDLLDFTLS